MCRLLEKIYLKEEFNPKFIGLFLPTYFMFKELYRNISNLAPNLSVRLLDISYGVQPYKGMFTVDECIEIGIDGKGRKNHTHADILYDGGVMPFEDKSFDSALSSEVIKQAKFGNGIEAVFQTMSNYIFRAFKWKHPFLLIVFLLIFPVNLIGLIFSKILPKNNDMYLGNIILAKKVKDL
jgi:hypothetical protein